MKLTRLLYVRMCLSHCKSITKFDSLLKVESKLSIPWLTCWAEYKLANILINLLSNLHQVILKSELVAINSYTINKTKMLLEHFLIYIYRCLISCIKYYFFFITDISQLMRRRWTTLYYHIGTLLKNLTGSSTSKNLSPGEHFFVLRILLVFLKRDWFLNFVCVEDWLKLSSSSSFWDDEIERDAYGKRYYLHYQKYKLFVLNWII